jgi:hypothetical protein
MELISGKKGDCYVPPPLLATGAPKIEAAAEAELAKVMLETQYFGKEKHQIWQCSNPKLIL